MKYLARKELDSGEILDRFLADDVEAGIRKINGWAGMGVKFDGGHIFRYSEMMDGVRYTLLEITP